MSLLNIGPAPSTRKSEMPADQESVRPAPVDPQRNFPMKTWQLLTATGLSVAVPLVVKLATRGRSRLQVVETEPLRSALAKVVPTQIGQDVTYLASDALKGRGTPSPGLKLAGEHVVARLKAHGWQPGGPDGYEYKYELWRATLNPAETRLSFDVRGSKRDLRLGHDYFYGSLSSPRGSVDLDLPTGESLVYAGRGLKKDLSGIDVRGKWLVCEDAGLPASERRRNAIEAGARGIVLLPPKGRPDPRYLQMLETRLELARSRGEVIFSPHFPIDEIVLSPQAAERFRRNMDFGASRKRLGIVGRPLTAGRRPAQISLSRKGFAVTETARQTEASNYVGFFAGSDPELSNEVVIITAHLDHLGQRMGRIYPGADDNASGSSALLALAEAIPQLKQERSVLLMWTTGEELGLLGSEAWARNPWLPAGRKAVANINIDMVGRNAADELLITPTADLADHYNGIVRRFEQMAVQEGIKLRSADQYWSRSDHYPFSYQLKIPVAFITNDTHVDYHKPTDIAAKIDPAVIARRTRLVIRVLDDLRGKL